MCVATTWIDYGKEAGVEIPGQGHHVINTFIDDVYIDRFCAKPYYRDQGADSPPAGPSVPAAPPQGSAAPFDPLVAHPYYSAIFEANQRSQIFLHDTMQQQFRNLSVAPEERTFPTRESYFTYCGWPETNPFPDGGVQVQVMQVKVALGIIIHSKRMKTMKLILMRCLCEVM